MLTAPELEKEPSYSLKKDGGDINKQLEYFHLEIDSGSRYKAAG
jgi:hypothetical protein